MAWPGFSDTPTSVIVMAGLNCSDHSKEIELYCETCGKLICLKCAIKGGKHEAHDYSELEEALVKYKEEITPTMGLMEEKLTSVDKALVELKSRSIEIYDNEATIEAIIHDTFRRLHNVLDVRETDLISHLHQVVLGKRTVLETLKKEMETIQAQLRNCLKLLKQNLKTENEGEILKMKNILVKQAQELTTPFQPDSLKLNIEADITFSASQYVTSVCQNYGEVYARNEPYPSKCHATGKGLEVAVVGVKSTVLMQTVNFKGEPFKERIEPQFELVSVITGASVRGSVENMTQGKYEISYEPVIRGKHELNIKVKGQHIRGSPFDVMVKLPVEKLSTSVSTICKMNKPWGITVNKIEEVVVTDNDRHCVYVFGSYGKTMLRSFGTRGSGRGQFDYPQGVAVDGEQNILVADRNNHRIQKFTADGNFLAMVGTEGSEHLQFRSVASVAYNASNNKYYAVDENHRVQILNSDFTFYKIFGNQGSHDGQFNIPWYIACDSIGNVYVADTYNDRIQIFTANGTFLRKFGRRGQGGGELYFPVGIAIDNNNLYISENCNHRISVFTSEGQFVKSFGKKGCSFGEFTFPRGLALDHDGMLYVCDYHNNSIHII